MSNFHITARYLSGRLDTVARNLDVEKEQVPLFARINGVQIPLTRYSFKVSDDGVLLFLDNIGGPDAIPVLDVWEAIGHDTGMNPSKEDLLDSLRYMAQIAAPIAAANPAWQAVIHERMRQVSVEGYHPDHDDEHTNGELLDACICYLIEVQCKSDDQDHASHVVPMEWPWAPECWKPATPRRMLEKALALGLAELERMIRAEAAASAQGEPSHG
ncbi:hypothetical protein [Pseudomonas aeruginosa]|uniref:hypothetical protein n=1 Tax=Pseudomonas aeruginosa TaxID=287 RepID=UPI00068F1FA0|nr:hypothetical protein [Pseudomonas aeruginosa]